MSVAKPQPKNSRRQTKQLVLVGLLSIGLVVAIVTQPSTSEPSTSDDASTEPSLGGAVGITAVAMASVSAPVHPVKAAPIDFSVTISLPKTDLATITDRQLFVPAKRLVAESARDSVATVQAVYGSHSKHAALMGTTIVKHGQAVNNGTAVVTVTANGVQLQTANQKTLDTR
ncbi:MAG: hypothetical protein WBD31_26660 [Rubripirellula sp.]